MAAPKQATGTAVAVPGSTALVGTMEERIKAFDHIAANLATLRLNGWDDVPKIKAACWLSDGAGMHPATFVQNHYCMVIQGKLMVEPKWEFVLGILQSRVPGFRFEVLEEKNESAKVRMSKPPYDEGSTQTVEYTVADAKRQGLFGRGGNMWTSGNTREGCFKQAVKRCARRLAAAALMDLPVGLDGYEVGEAPAPTPAEALDDAIAKATGTTTGVTSAVDVAFEEEPAGDDTPRSQGAEPEAQPPAPEPGSERAAAPADAPKPQGRAVESAQDAYDALMVTVARARKLFTGRKFILEAPPESGKFWFVDHPTLVESGTVESVRLQIAGEIVAPSAQIDQLNRILSAECDSKERGGRP